MGSVRVLCAVLALARAPCGLGVRSGLAEQGMRPVYEVYGQGQRKEGNAAATHFLKARAGAHATTYAVGPGDSSEGKNAKMAAVNKVTQLLQALQEKILAEGEKEAATYNKFACFCKDTTSEKTKDIEAGGDRKNALTADINSLSEKRTELDYSIAGFEQDIEEAEEEKREKADARERELAQYEKNVADLISAIESLEGALKTLKASEKPSLVQLQAAAGTVRTAAFLADALGLGDARSRRAAEMPAVNMEDYKFHSDDIIATLEGLLKDFKDQKNEVDKLEVEAVHTYKSFMQAKADFIKQTNLDLEKHKKDKDLTHEAIATASQELTTVAATLLDDKEYLKELSKMCSEKAKTWDQRSSVRHDELATLTSVIGVVASWVAGNTSAATIRFMQQGASVHVAEAVARDPKAMEAVEAAAEEADAGVPPALLQMAPGQPAAARQQQPSLLSTHLAVQSEGPQQAVADMLRSQGDRLHSTLLTSLASRVTADPFAKVKQLIQELIQRLLQEAGNEANQKGWCDKGTADAKQRRDLAAGEVEELNGRMMELEARRDTLHAEIEQLRDEIQALDAKVNETEKLRWEESAENGDTVAEAKSGQKATEVAIDVLQKFYKTVDDATVDLSLTQKQPMDDAPDAGFKIGEAYTGAQSEAGGVIGMLDVIRSDFVRTIVQTERAEKQAQKEFLAFMTESGKSIEEKETAEKQKIAEKDDAEAKLASAEDDLRQETGILKTALAELQDLKKVCVDTGMSYEERVARREGEMEALNKALCVLKAYQEYGPEGSQEC